MENTRSLPSNTNSTWQQVVIEATTNVHSTNVQSSLIYMRLYRHTYLQVYTTIDNAE